MAHIHSLRGPRSRASSRGAAMVEYALLLFAVLIVAAFAIKSLGKPVRASGDKAVEALVSRR